ncbi:hypothetical protein [Bifidobacterium felsineum]|uniref:hypothetical protein n=1 Tax=Bifidobacterium felsineum TaxID=2045440 RepID=UPI001BDBF44E|nr:hypothetical protein [Bifidobacterium felsineum]MBT1164574.1 hypothetical protein [Bifidobacterium felsineum]
MDRDTEDVISMLLVIIGTMSALIMWRSHGWLMVVTSILAVACPCLLLAHYMKDHQ